MTCRILYNDTGWASPAESASGAAYDLALIGANADTPIGERTSLAPNIDKLLTKPLIYKDYCR
jgi:hypothetical protein